MQVVEKKPNNVGLLYRMALAAWACPFTGNPEIGLWVLGED
jgi:hypothetical protein